jgi:hypothetical protein
MAIRPNLSTPELREWWEWVRKCSEEVKAWPAWMKGKPQKEDRE